MNRVRLVVLVTLLGLGAAARAADAKAADPKIVAEIEAHDKAFLAAYENGETKKMKAEIGKAVSLGEKNGLGSDALMADTYVLAAIFDVDGSDNQKAGVRDFVKALKIKADVTIPKGMATSGVKAALKQAREQAGLAPKEGAGAAVAAAKPAETSKEPAAAKAGDQSEKAQKTDVAAERAQEAERAKQERDAQLAEAKAREERDAQDKRDEQQKAASDKQLADARSRAQQAEKDRADDARRLADKDKQLAAANARVAQLEKDKADDQRRLADEDKRLAAANARVAQLEKDKADDQRRLVDKDKQLADLRAQEGKEREALDKASHDRQAAEAQARADETRRKQAQQERDRLFAGPELPRTLREPLTCAVPDEAPLRADLYVHCVARGNVKARSIIFYYRTTAGGTSKYYTVPMERTAKGWYAAVVPGAHVFGKVLQYYAEALDAREAVVARNGKESSPNILTLRPGAPRS